jgi:hypothetical protein
MGDISGNESQRSVAFASETMQHLKFSRRQQERQMDRA